MGIKYLWDTNISIYYLNRIFPIQAERFVDGILKESPPCISAITEIELLSWKAPTQNYVDLIGSFINDSLVIELEQAIKLRAAEIRKIHKLKLPDAVIAATAVVYNCTLLTRDVKDFDNIKELKVFNPWTIE